MFSRAIRSVENVITWIGERTKWLTSLLVLLIFGDVLLRYFFSTSKAWINDLEWHVFALIFLFGAAYAFKEDQHVRVDVFYTKWSEHRKAWVNLIGTLCFLIPWCLVVIVSSFQYAEHAFAIGEQSAEPGGLHARFLIKGAITVGFVLLLLQAITVAVSSCRSILHTSKNTA